MPAAGLSPTQTRIAALALLIPVCIVVCVLCALPGEATIDWSRLFDSQANFVLWRLRVPRILLGAAAGAGLAVGGVIFQILFRNPLATPYTLGIDSGAALGAAVGYLLGWRGSVLGMPVIMIGSLLGASAAVALVFLSARLRGGRDMTHLLLAGICIAYLCSAGIMLINYLAGQAVTNDIVRWMMGSLAILRPTASAEIGLLLIPVLAFACWAHRGYDLLALGDDLAAARGAPVKLLVWGSFVLVAGLTAMIVSSCGPIGFVSLMVPHICGMLVGRQSLFLIVGSAGLGAAFLCLCDTVARLPAYEIPVGVLTNILGAAFFFYLLATRGSERTTSA